jgi:hypothetical protein
MICTVCLLLITISLQAGEIEKIKPEAKVFFYYYLDVSSYDNKAFTERNSEFDFSRIYAGLKYQLSDNFMARFLTDVGHRDKTGQLEVFAKYAYLDWNLEFLGTHFIMGLQTTYNWKQPEKMWGYRGIQYAPMESFHKYWGGVAEDYIDALRAWAVTDSTKASVLSSQASNFSEASRSGMGSSADIGVGLSMKPVKEYYLMLMVRNGLGYKKAEDDFFKNVQVRTGYYLFEKALHLTGYIEAEPWKGVDDNNRAKTYTNIHWDAAASFEMKDIFLIGANVNSKYFPGSMESITALCASGFGNAHIIKKRLKALVRYEYYITGINNTKQPSGGDKPKTNTSLIIAGIDFIPAKGVNIVPNVQVWKHEDTKRPTERGLFIHLIYKY